LDVIVASNTVLVSGFAPGYYATIIVLFTKNSEHICEQC